MKSLNKTLNKNTKNKTEENKIRDRFCYSLRNKILKNNKNRFNYNPIRIINNRSTFQIKPKNEKKNFKINKKIKKYFDDRNSCYFPFNSKKSNNLDYNKNEEKDNLIYQLANITKDLNKIDIEIKELQVLYSHEEKENAAHKYIIQKILNENQEVEVLCNFDSPRNSKDQSLEENNDRKLKMSTLEAKSIKKESQSKNRTLPNSMRQLKTRNTKRIDTLKKGIVFYQKLIDSKDKKLKNFNKKEGAIIYKNINTKINLQNKNYENLSKINNDMINKVYLDDEKIFDLNQKLSKLKDKTNKYIENIENYKNKISETEIKINNLKNERKKRKKEEKEQELIKSKEESELNSLINEKNILEEKYDKKIELKFEQHDYIKELENSYIYEKQFKLKNEVNSQKLEHYKIKNEEFNKKIEEYEKERNYLLEQSKVPQKHKKQMEEMEIEMAKLIAEVETYDKKLKHINQIIEEQNKINKEEK